MGTTAKRSLRWPTATVGVKPNVAQDIRNLAEDVDAVFAGSVTITDWNAATTTGSYFGNSNSANAPQSATQPHFGFVIATAGGAVEQLAGRADGGSGTNPMFRRYYSTSAASWTPWMRLADADTIAITGTDLNTLSSSGTYQGTSLGNAPGGTANLFLVQVSYMDSNTQVQTAVDLANRITWMRRKYSGGWSGWHQNVDDANIGSILGDTGWSLTPIVPASGWGNKTDPKGNATGTLKGGVRAVGQFVEYRFQLTRTSATSISASASGNIGGDPVIATVNPTTYPQFVPSSIVDDAFDVIGVQAGVARIDDAGQITISALYPNDTINQNDVIQVSLRFLAG